VKSFLARRAPAVHWSYPAGEVRAVVLVLHGGKVRSRRTPRSWQLAVLRMGPFARALHVAGRADGLAVGRVLFHVRGWNRDEASPVADVRAVLANVRARFGSVPVVLVGHSMGGRAALRAADDASVVAVLALAPWLESGDAVGVVRGKELLVLHGDRDRWTDSGRSRAFVDEARQVAAGSTYVTVRGEGHSMLGRAGLWHDLAVAFTFRALGWSLTGQSERRVAANDTLNEATAASDPISV
jgi:pimeloyl-ACP methyl ester carboxylesterase